MKTVVFSLCWSISWKKPTRIKILKSTTELNRLIIIWKRVRISQHPLERRACASIFCCCLIWLISMCLFMCVFMCVAVVSCGRLNFVSSCNEDWHAQLCCFFRSFGYPAGRLWDSYATVPSWFPEKINLGCAALPKIGQQHQQLLRRIVDTQQRNPRRRVSSVFFPLSFRLSLLPICHVVPVASRNLQLHVLAIKDDQWTWDFVMPITDGRLFDFLSPPTGHSAVVKTFCFFGTNSNDLPRAVFFFSSSPIG